MYPLLLTTYSWLSVENLQKRIKADSLSQCYFPDHLMSADAAIDRLLILDSPTSGNLLMSILSLNFQTHYYSDGTMFRNLSRNINHKSKLMRCTSWCRAPVFVLFLLVISTENAHKDCYFFFTIGIMWFAHRLEITCRPFTTFDGRRK